MKKIAKAQFLKSIALVGALGVLSAIPARAESLEFVEKEQSEERILRVRFRVNEMNLQCVPLDNKTNFLQDHFELILHAPEVARHFRVLGNRPLSKLYGSAQLCANARTVILKEASKQGGRLERTVRIEYSPRIYYWSGDVCFDAEREFASLFLGVETGYGEIGPSVTGHARQDHFKVEGYLCPRPEYPY